MSAVESSPERDVELRRDLELASDAHRRLVADLDALVHICGLDVTAPSLLPDWTIGHVITHVTNSGEGHVRILEGATRGAVALQYPHGMDGRSADIEAGASRPAVEQVADLRRSIETLERCWGESSWEGRGIVARGAEVAITELPFLRMREVAIHHIDLDLGATFSDLPAEYVRLELRRMEMMWTARQPMGLTSLPAAVLATAPSLRLAWLMGRVSIDGVAAAKVF